MKKQMFSLALAAALLLSLLPTRALAGGTSITASNPTELADAFANVADGGVIEMAGYFALPVTLTIANGDTRSFTLNLKNMPLTAPSGAPAIRHAGSGTLTITDSAEYGALKSDVYQSTLITLEGGSLAVTGGKLTTANTGSVVIKNIGDGDISISGGTVSALGGGSRAISNEGNGDVSVSGGTVKTNGDECYGVYNAAGGTVSVSQGGEITTLSAFDCYGIYNHAAGAVSLSSAAVSALGMGSYGVYNHGTGAVRVLSGTVTVKGFAQAMNTAPDLSGYTPAPTITAGANMDGSQVVAYNPADMTGYRYLQFTPPTAGGTVPEAAAALITALGGEAYAEYRGEKVTLLQDVTLASGIEVNGAVALDLAGRAILYRASDPVDASSSNSVRHAISVGSGGALTVSDSGSGGAIVGRGVNTSVANRNVFPSAVYVAQGGALTVHSGTLRGGNGVSSGGNHYRGGNGLYADGDLIITGGSFIGGDSAACPDEALPDATNWHAVGAGGYGINASGALTFSGVPTVRGGNGGNASYCKTTGGYGGGALHYSGSSLLTIPGGSFTGGNGGSSKQHRGGDGGDGVYCLSTNRPTLESGAIRGGNGGSGIGDAAWAIGGWGYMNSSAMPAETASLHHGLPGSRYGGNGGYGVRGGLLLTINGGSVTGGNGGGTPTYRNVTLNLSHITAAADKHQQAISGQGAAISGREYSVLLTADDGYRLPDALQVTVGGAILEEGIGKYDYEAFYKSLQINGQAINGDVVVTAQAVPTTYTLTVVDGTGGGEYAAEAQITITANAPAADKVFDRWVLTSGGGILADAAAPTTTFTMPAKAATVTATYKEAPPAPPTVTAVWIAPISVYVEKGASKQFTAQVKGTNSPSQEVTWTVTGGVAGTTVVDGLLTVAAEETATELTVKATSAADPSKFEAARVYVGAAPATPTAAISGSPAIVVGESIRTSFTLSTTNVPVGTGFLVLGPPPTGSLPLGVSQNTFSTTGDVTTVFLSAVGSECAIGEFPLRVRLTGHASLLETSAGVTLLVSEAQTPPATLYPLGVVNGTGSGGYVGGTPVTITADPAPTGKQFKKWIITPAVTFLDGTNEQSAAARFTMPEEGASAEATYEDIPVSVTGVTLNPAAASVQKGTTQRFTATVSGTGSFVNTVVWTVTGGGAGTSITDGLLSVAAGETATTLTVKAAATADTSQFAIASIAVTDVPVVTYPLTVTGGTGSGEYEAGAQITIAANTPAEGKVFDKWVLTSGALDDANSAAATYTMPANAATVTATYRDAPAVTHTITASAGAGGTISPNGPVSVANGGGQGFTISASDHYRIASVTVDGVDQGAVSAYTFSDVTGDHTISAVFSYNGSAGGSSSGSRITIVTPPATQDRPYPPTTAEIKLPAVVDQGGNAAVTAPETSVTAAIKAAQDAAKKAGTEKNGIAVTVDATTNKGAKAITATLPQRAVAEAVKAEVVEVQIKSEAATITLDLATLRAAQAIAGGGITVSARPVKTNTLSAAAQAAVGSRPVFDLTLRSGGKSITDFSGGAVSVTLPYTLQAGESAEGVVIYYLERDEKRIELPAVYDPKAGAVTFTANHFSLYAIGYDAVAALPNPFSDVAESAYYRNAAVWAADSGVTAGTGAGRFSPDAACTRAQTVTFLWRAMGSPAPTAAVNPFTDVKADAYYYKAVLWAVERGITSGTSATAFSPDASVSRGQAAALLWRAAGKPTASKASPFTDVSADAYYFDAVLWAAEKGITSGSTATSFGPASPCVRGQIVTFLYRHFGK